MKNSTNKILIIALVLLLLVNIAMLVFIIKGKGQPPRGRGKGGPFDKMVKELNMNDQQKKQYDSLREAHFSTIRPILDSMRVTRQALFNLMKEESLNDSVINNYSATIAEKQYRADRLTLEHFRKVRSLFNGDQQKKFDDFVQKMMQRNSRKKDSTGKDSDHR